MNADAYCIKVCGGKCCYLHHKDIKVRCPHLESDNRCGIYADRFGPGSQEKEVVGLFVLPSDPGGGHPKLAEFWCWRIERILAHNLLPEEVRAQCCYAHPELLEEKADGDKSCNQK